MKIYKEGWIDALVYNYWGEIFYTLKKDSGFLFDYSEWIQKVKCHLYSWTFHIIIGIPINQHWFYNNGYNQKIWKEPTFQKLYIFMLAFLLVFDHI